MHKEKLNKYTHLLGSTHNFINEKASKLIGCTLQEMSPQDVSVPDGRIYNQYKVVETFNG